MTTGDYTETRVIDYTDRQPNSASGNPRYRVHFNDGPSALTEPDASVNYDIPNLTNSQIRDQAEPVIVTFNSHHRIVRMQTPVLTRYRTTFRHNDHRGARVRVAWTEPATGRERQQTVPLDYNAKISDKYRQAVATVADVPLTMVIEDPTDPHRFTVRI